MSLGDFFLPLRLGDNLVYGNQKKTKNKKQTTNKNLPFSYSYPLLDLEKKWTPTSAGGNRVQYAALPLPSGKVQQKNMHL